jgi:hypothetical protein
MQKILTAVVLPKVVSWLRTRYGAPHASRDRAF